jgi:hypothetical protein
MRPAGGDGAPGALMGRGSQPACSSACVQEAERVGMGCLGAAVCPDCCTAHACVRACAGGRARGGPAGGDGGRGAACAAHGRDGGQAQGAHLRAAPPCRAGPGGGSLCHLAWPSSRAEPLLPCCAPLVVLCSSSRACSPPPVLCHSSEPPGLALLRPAHLLPFSAAGDDPADGGGLGTTHAQQDEDEDGYENMPTAQTLTLVTLPPRCRRR